MLKEIELSGDDIAPIVAQLAKLRESEDVLIIRNGARTIPKQRWIALLEERCGLIPDRRHFDPMWAAKDAQRNKVQHETGQRGESVSAGGTDEQIRAADWWEISYQPDREVAYAYSKTPQPLHTDNAWFADPAEINFFIMEKQAPLGGEQTIYPVTRLIDDLNKDSPELLNDLCTREVVIKKGDHEMFNRTTIIRLGRQPKVFWNYYRTDKAQPHIAKMCDAFFAYLTRRVDTPSVERSRCESGDCFSFNDLHMLHGRTAFKAEKPRDRVLLHSMWKLP